MHVGSAYSELSNEQIQTLIANYRRLNRTEDQKFADLLAEEARRKGRRLDLSTTFDVVSKAAREGRCISYGQVAAASGVEWSSAHRAIGPHLDQLLQACHQRGLPLLSAIVVNQQNIASRRLEPSALKGFIDGVQRLGIAVTDAEQFLHDAQDRVFAWGRAAQ